MMLALYDPSPVGGHLTRRSLDFAQEQALEVCGLAWTNENDSARVNAFGPLAFCEYHQSSRPIRSTSVWLGLGGRYLQQQHHQEALVKLFYHCSLSTGWPVEEIIHDLRVHWTAETQ